MEKNSSPLSPHIQIYKWQFSSLLSITHRLTGVINTFGFFLIVLWILFLALGPECYNFYQSDNIYKDELGSIQLFIKNLNIYFGNDENVELMIIFVSIFSLLFFVSISICSRPHPLSYF